MSSSGSLPRKRITLAEVAKVAAVSPITVSRVINHPHKVSPRVREKVQEAIDRLGYIPNQFASSLATARSGVIGVSIPSLSNIVFNDVLRGIYDVAGKSGYKVLMVDTHYSALEEEKLVRTLLSQSPEAMIITGGDQTEACRRMLERAAVPVVQMMELLEDPVDMNVGFSHLQAGYDVAAKLLATGCHRIGFLGARMDTRVQQRLQGYRRALDEAGEYRPSLVITTPKPSSIAMGGELFRELMAAGEGEVDAVFCCNDDLAMGALFESQRMNIKVPGELSLCGFNDIEAAAFINPSLSSVHVSRYRMGATAAEMVLRALSEGGVALEEKKINTGYEIKVRDSIRTV